VAAVAHSLGDCELDDRRPEAAAAHYRTAIVEGARLGSPLLLANALGGVAAITAERGDGGIAARLWSAARALERDAGHPLLGESERRRYEPRLGDVEMVDVAPDDALQLASAYLD